MKRELAIVAGVLVPFAVLVAAGFYFSAPKPPPPPAPLPMPVAVPTTKVEPKPSPPAVVIDAGVVVQEESPPRFPRELAAPLEAVEAEVHQCFADQRVQQPHDVRVKFTPTREGGYADVRVDEQDPMLAACIEDVFAELHWQPRGPETYQPAEHVFSLAPRR